MVEPLWSVGAPSLGEEITSGRRYYTMIINKKTYHTHRPENISNENFQPEV
jgi:hypothetical protein